MPPIPPRRKKVRTPAKRADGPVAWPDHSRSTPTAMPANAAMASRATRSCSFSRAVPSDGNRENGDRCAAEQVLADVAGAHLARRATAPDANHQQIGLPGCRLGEDLGDGNPAADRQP